MRLKPAIQIVEFSNFALIIALLVGLFSFAIKSGGAILVIEALIAFPFLFAFFFRMMLINLYLKKCKYPVPFLAVLEKLGLTKNLNIKWSAEAEKDIDRPTYPTEIFLVDNKLITDIGNKKMQVPLIFISIAISIFALFYFSKKFTFQQKPFLFISILVISGINIYQWYKGKKQQNDLDPKVQFKDTGLYIYDRLFNWKDIFDWNYIAGGKNTSDKIIVKYYDDEKNIYETMVNLGELNTDKIDFMLLLTHFKSKYG